MSTVTTRSPFGPSAPVRANMADTERTFRALSRAFRISLHILVCLASVMLAWAEGTWHPIGFTLPLALVAFFITGPGRRSVHMPNQLANVAGAVALFACYREFVGGTQEDRLLAGAHLLVYLMWIVLFQKKTDGTYWWMIALTMLQVAIGPLLRESADYGMALVGYSLVTMWTLSVFSVYRAYAAGREEAEIDVEPESSSAVPSGSPRLVDLRSASRTEPTVHLDERPGVLGFKFATGVVGATFAALCVSFLVFLVFPRFWIGQQFIRDADLIDGQSKMVGFSESVRLGEVGSLLESNERVLEVRIYDPDGEPVDVEQYAYALGYGEPIFRGKVVDDYDDGQWSASGLRPPRNTRVGPRRDMYRHEYRLEPTGSDILFTMQPVREVYLREDSQRKGARRARYSTEYTRPETSDVNNAVEYVAYTRGTTTDGPLEEATDFSVNERFYQLSHLVHHRQGEFPRIEEFVAENRRALFADERSPRDIANEYLRFLRDSGDFGYSLRDTTPPDGTDPVENFLFQRKTGHCEYFASALALLLRETGIPARVIIGFKGGTPNRFTGNFEVEQRHAHAWVEAYFSEKAIHFPRSTRWRNTVENISGGRWAVLDPTPAAARSESVDEQARRLGSFEDFKRYVLDQWDWFVVKMNRTKQMDQIYRPIRDFALNAWNASLGDAESRRKLREMLVEMFRSPASWFSPVGFVATFLLLTVLYTLRWLVRLVVRLVFGGGSGGEGSAGRAPIRVAFWERFVAACERLGLERSPSQTQLEFAATVRGRLGELGEGVSAELPDDVVRDFYAVRFGATPLPDDRLSDLEARLAALESAVAAVPG